MEDAILSLQWKLLGQRARLCMEHANTCGRDQAKVGIRIAGTGKYLPETTVTNEDFTRFVETSDEWITTRTGISSRPVETRLFSWEMGVRAAEEAIRRSGIPKEQIGLVIATTVSPDYLTPSMSCLAANGLGLSAPACFDVNCACAGFVQAVDMAEKYLSSGAFETVLIISSEMMSKVVNYQDRSTCVLFGDGAGAAVLQRGSGIYTSEMGSDPAGGGGGFMRGIPPSSFFRPKEEPFDPLSDGWPVTQGFELYQNGREVYKFATRALPTAVRAACAKAGIEPAELSMIFPHQANARIIETAAKNLGLPMERFFLNIADHGNLSSACIPIELREAEEAGLLHRGDRICLVGFGGGLVYAGCVLEW